MSRRLFAALICIGLAAAFVSCTEKETIVCPQEDDLTHMVKVSGQVRAFRCLPYEDDYNNLGKELRYTVATGERATVKFVRLTGLTFALETDDSSAFSLLLDSGAYTIVVDCPHAYPDTFFNMYFSSDTVLDLRILYDYLDSDSIHFSFNYRFQYDTLGEVEERACLGRLGSYIGGMFEARAAGRKIYYNELIGWYVYYAAPMVQPYRVWQAYERSERIVGNPAYDFPDFLDVSDLAYI